MIEDGVFFFCVSVLSTDDDDDDDGNGDEPETIEELSQHPAKAPQSKHRLL